jgi:predicted RNA-binding protein
MCEANAYVLSEDGKEALYLESVDVIRPEEGKLFLKNLFGEQKLFDGSIREISLIRHRIVLERRG